ncbi:hypothetical protein ACM39_03530 [Chryseobacterium sp. FH2]|uniref:hypothetical protein n=1 Tax=Chryseobacterium sp. FH2 TaxID=1674291 RepID=UPI00065AA826|nr:hypothetical protein [Chryseobacterium sp. FH2]KMQ69190.1 hypothetical protein ACM39_03530 [Chryseobacterium sp. FH2]
MKKLLFIAMVGIAGFASAKGNVEKVDSKAKEVTTVTKKAALSKKNTKTKAKAVFFAECRTVVVSCISAYTCQDWSEGQWNTWGSNIQSNYCMYDSPYTP